MLQYSLRTCINRFLALLLWLLVSQAVGAYQLVDLGRDASPLDINNFGVVVGSRNTSQYPASAFGISETGSVSGNAAGNNPYRTTSIPCDPAVLSGNKWDVMNIARVYPRGTGQGVCAGYLPAG